jgi:hypothetical protein
MGLVIPSGSPVIPAEEGAGGGGATSSWTEQYIVDWSAEAAHDWKSNSMPVPVQGADWGGTGMAQAATAGCTIVPGTGVEITPEPTVSSEYYGAMTAPRLYAKVSNWAPYAGVYPSATPLQAICFQALIQGNVTQDDNGYGMSITAGGGKNVSIERMYSSSVWPAGSNSGYRISNSYNTVSGVWSALSSAEDGNVYELFEIVLFPGSLVLASIRNETEFVDPLGAAVWRRQMNPGRDFVCPPPLPGGIYNANDEALNAWLPADAYPQFFAYNNVYPDPPGPHLNSHTATVKAFRVLSLGVL